MKGILTVEQKMFHNGRYKLKHQNWIRCDENGAHHPFANVRLNIDICFRWIFNHQQFWFLLLKFFSRFFTASRLPYPAKIRKPILVTIALDNFSSLLHFQLPLSFFCPCSPYPFGVQFIGLCRFLQRRNTTSNHWSYLNIKSTIFRLFKPRRQHPRINISSRISRNNIRNPSEGLKTWRDIANRWKTHHHYTVQNLNEDIFTVSNEHNSDSI